MYSQCSHVTGFYRISHKHHNPDLQGGKHLAVFGFRQEN